MGGSLLAQGIELMLVGMGTVFVFLTALVIATTVMSRVVAGSAGVERPAAARPAGDRPDEEELAAIAAAVELHRRRGAGRS